MRAAGLSLIRAHNFAEQVTDAIIGGIALGKLEPSQRIVEVDLAR